MALTRALHKLRSSQILTMARCETMATMTAAAATPTPSAPTTMSRMPYIRCAGCTMRAKLLLLGCTFLFCLSLLPTPPSSGLISAMFAIWRVALGFGIGVLLNLLFESTQLPPSAAPTREGQQQQQYYAHPVRAACARTKDTLAAFCIGFAIMGILTSVIVAASSRTWGEWICLGICMISCYSLYQSGESLRNSERSQTQRT
jgi:hypothetical protein